MSPLPIRIEPCPIAEAIFEVRYQARYPSEAVFGVVFRTIRDLFDSNNRLPIVDLPETIRDQDPNLKYQALYELRKGPNIRLRIGPRVLTFANTRPYPGWTEWSAFIASVLSKLAQTDVIDFAERLGVRYINVFEHSILDRVNLSVSVIGHDLPDQTTTIRTEFWDGEMTKVLHVANRVHVMFDGAAARGSVIDIDCLYPFDREDDFYETYPAMAAAAHQAEKKLFFELLKPEFLDTLNPSYQE